MNEKSLKRCLNLITTHQLSIRTMLNIRPKKMASGLAIRRHLTQHDGYIGEWLTYALEITHVQLNAHRATNALANKLTLPQKTISRLFTKPATKLFNPFTNKQVWCRLSYYQITPRTCAQAIKHKLEHGTIRWPIRFKPKRIDSLIQALSRNDSRRYTYSLVHEHVTKQGYPDVCTYLGIPGYPLFNHVFLTEGAQWHADKLIKNLKFLKDNQL